jgi:hypothetical protein
MSTRSMSKADLETLANFRYRLRRFLRFSEEATRDSGVTPLQYQLMLQIKGFPGRDWATITASSRWCRDARRRGWCGATRAEAISVASRSG